MYVCVCILYCVDPAENRAKYDWGRSPRGFREKNDSGSWGRGDKTEKS